MPTQTKHPKSRREILRRAGLSEESELSEARIHRADSKEAKEILERQDAQALYRFIMGAGRHPGQPTAAAKYTDEVREAAKVCREITGGVGAPGPKQVAAVVAAIGKTTPIEASGMAGRTLRRYATGSAKPKPTPEMNEIASRCDGDPFCRGRKLAVILCAIDAVRRGGR